MGIFEATVLGIVQGLTELLPISSSGHLAIIPWLFNWTITERFDIALHIGTLIAILVYFYKEWLDLFKGGFNLVVKKEKTQEGTMFWYLVAATVPGAVIGFIIDKLFGGGLSSMILLEAGVLIIMGIILYIVDEKSPNKTEFKDLTFKQTFLIGLSQTLAFIPGVSRSGITMTAGRALGVSREATAKFSFLMSTPIVFGAIILKITDFVFEIPFFIGILASGIVGFLVIELLMNYLKKGSFKIFAIYRIVLGLAVIAIYFIRG